jgi:hypothetical protein
MLKRIFCCISLLGLLFAAGCQIFNPAPTQDAAALLAESNLATVNAISTANQNNVNLNNQNQATQQASQVAAKPTSTPSPGSITITSIQEVGPGRAIVYWDAIGEFPSGYKIVWTDQQGKPTYPENTSAYTGDPYARSAMISGTPGRIYYVRVCRFLNDACDIYSNLGIFAFVNTSPTAPNPGTKTPTVPATVHTKVPVVPTGSSLTKILITFMSGGADGKAFMMWDATGSFTAGFKIVYSKTNQTPTAGSDPYFKISDSGARTAYVNGDPGAKYYYRICRVTADTCDSYSPVFAYLFAGSIYTPTPDPAVITITEIKDKTTGTATVTWTATGTFPAGFKVVFSKTNHVPTLSDSYVYVSDGSLRTAVVAGEPSTFYYFRVCKYFDGRCVAYSPVKTFTFAAAPSPTPDGSTITNVKVNPNTVIGKATITWDAAGVFPFGFKILSSTTETIPTYENASSMVLVSEEAARTFKISGNPRTTYYYRICKYTGSGCGVYSGVVSFTYPDATVDSEFVLTNTTPTSGQVGLIWTLLVDNPGGYKVLYGFSNPPYFPDNPSVLIADRSARTYLLTGLGSGTTYYIRLCEFNGTVCTTYSNTLTVDMP